MTRGRCGSLFLHRVTLSFTTPRRFNPAHGGPIMGDLNPFSFSTFDYLTPLFKYQNDPKKLDAAVRDGDPEALMWKRAPASMNANGGRTRIGGSIATGARSATPTAPTPAPRP